jgi:regulator of sirC expression with transglutaminase-like and TPR domain
MATTQDLPHLISLLDDDSPVVREAVMRELFAFGDALPGLLDALPTPPSPAQQATLRLVLGDHLRRALREGWGAWLALDDDYARLEAAQTMLAEFQNGPAYPAALGDLLDGLAADFRAKYGERDAHVLARHLFEELGFAGERRDYHAPQNSNLVRVIESRKGIPISLVCVFMLVGRRLGMDVRGINWPEHFLARVFVNSRETIYDVYQRGPGIDRESFLKMQGPSREAAEAILNQSCDAATIMARVLRNLVRAYDQEGQEENSELMLELLQDLERAAHRS